MVGIVADVLDGCTDRGGVERTETSYDEIRLGSHTAVCGVGMVVGDGDVRPVDDDRRTTGCRTGVCAVIFIVGVVGQTRNL